MSDHDLTDTNTVREFLELLHSRAAAALSHQRRPGVLQLVSIAPDDCGMTISHFAVGDIDHMVEAALTDARAGRNVYVEARTVRPGRPTERGRGKIESTIGCFALVIDRDGDTSRAGGISGSDTTVVETSSGNSHEWLFLRRGLDAGDAKPLGVMIRLRAEIDRSYAKAEQQTEKPAPPVPDASIDGAELLNQVYRFLGRFVAYPDRHSQVAHTLWIAHTHLIDRFETTPRLAFISPEPASGKTRALEITELLVPNPVLAVNVSPAYLIRKVAAEEGVTILFDEVDTVFGKRAKETNEDVRALLNAGYRRGAVSGRVVMQGATAITEELPSFAPVALAGLGTGIADRDADCWEALFAVADVAGDPWSDIARVAGVSAVSASQGERGERHGIRLLSDLRKIIGAADYKLTAVILKELAEMDESPWADIRGKPLTDVGLAARLRPYGIKPKICPTRSSPDQSLFLCAGVPLTSASLPTAAAIMLPRASGSAASSLAGRPLLPIASQFRTCRTRLRSG